LDYGNGLPPTVLDNLPVLNIKEPGYARWLRAYRGDTVEIPPHSWVLGRSVERFVMPANVAGYALGKSSFARGGITTLITPLEPEWRGYLTIEVVNCGGFPALLFAGEGIAQIRFDRGALPERGYAGNYQDQPDAVTPARVEG
jgi:dCTP deaminase